MMHAAKKLICFNLLSGISFMSDHASVSLDKAITTGLSEVTLHRTMELYNAYLASNSERTLNFRGDLAEAYHYDKVTPLKKPALTKGYVVLIEATSQKTGETGLYQILANQWKLLEVLARID